MRSKLFVPGTRPEFFAKALEGEADAVSFDLEDAVAYERKDEARANVSAFLKSPPARVSNKLLIVRVNAPGTTQFEADIEACVEAGIDLVNLPKIESADAVRAAAAVLAKAEGSRNVRVPARLLLTIETPRSLHNAAAIAAADPRVAGLQLGLGDLFEPCGIDRRDVANVHAAMFALRLAAAQAGVFAYDAAFADVGDEAGYVAEAAMARRLGYLGKTCIHPRQVALANLAFQPDEAEIALARRIVAFARESGQHGRSAFLVDGRMIDRPFLQRAQAIVAAADAATGATR